MPARKRRRSRPGPDPAMALPSGRMHFVSPEIDLHGMRAGEARDAAQAHLLACHDDRIPIARFIHGHGEGILKQVVTDLLTTSPLVAKHYPDVNSGTTAAELLYGEAHRAYNRRANHSITPRAERRK